MQFIWKILRQKPDLSSWQNKPLAKGVTIGPRPADHRDCYERIVADEASGDPEPDGAFRHLAGAILRYDIFPSKWVSGVLRREPIQVGDLVGICYHFMLGLDLF